MTSTCISNCVKDARVPVRATYVNLYKWPESDVEFIRSLSTDKRKNGGGTCGHPKVVDSISCRQLYLRSYTFSRDECMDDQKVKKSSKTRRIRGSCVSGKRRHRSRGSSSTGSSHSSDNGGRRRCAGIRRAKEASCVALSAIFRRLLYCTTKIDVVG